MQIQKRDLMTPANVLTLTGLVITIIGALHLNTLTGAILFAVGRALDLADGWLARRTRSSDLGAALDAAADKIAIASVLIMAWHFSLAPTAVLAFVALQNILNAAVSTYANQRKRRLSVSRYGKYSMFGQIVSIGAFIFAGVLSIGELHVAGWIIFAASAPLAASATYGYFHTAVQKRQ